MKISKTARSAAGLVIQVLVPALLVVAVRSISLNTGPASAAASQPDPEPIPAAPAPQPEEFALSPAAVRQTQDALKSAGNIIVRDPFVSSALKTEDAAIARLLPLDGQDRPVAPPPPRPPSMRISSIAVGRETVAVINDRVVRIGDRIDADWTVVRIDAASEAVTIALSDGTEQTFTISH